MLQAHNFIPHHHDEEAIEANHHHDHDDGNDETDHNFPFSDLNHNAEFGKIIAKPHFDNEIIETPAFSESILFRLYDKFAAFESPPRPHPPDNESPLHLIFLSHSLPLRAPPALTC